MYSVRTLRQIYGPVTHDVIRYLRFFEYAVPSHSDIFIITPDAIEIIDGVARRGRIERLKTSWGFWLNWFFTILANVVAFFALFRH